MYTCLCAFISTTVVASQSSLEQMAKREDTSRYPHSLTNRSNARVLHSSKNHLLYPQQGQHRVVVQNSSKRRYGSESLH